MKNFLISFGGTEQGVNRHNTTLGIHRDYESETKRLWQSSSGFFNGFFKYDNDWLKSSSYYQDPNTKRVLDEPSFGWAFKGICILDALEQIDDGDVLFWCDSNHVFVSNPQPIIDKAIQHGLFVHEHWGVVYPNKNWTQRDMFVKMDCDEYRYWQAPQMQVNVMVFYKTEFTMNFVKEWVKYCTDYDCIIRNDMENFPGYVNHRHEQSVLSILVEKYKVPYFQDPYQVVYEMDGIAC